MAFAGPIPALYPGYRLFFLFCRVAGCCPIEGLLTKARPRDLRVRTGPWYAVYMFVVFLLFLWSGAGVVAFQRKLSTFTIGTPIMVSYVYCALLYVVAAANAVCVFWNTRSFLDLVLVCGALEARIGLRRSPDVEKRLTCLSRRFLLFVVLDGAKFLVFTGRIVTMVLPYLGKLHNWYKLILIALFVAGVFLLGLWFALFFWLMAYNAGVLREYFACVNDSLVCALKAPSGCTRSLREVRLNQAALRDVLFKMNSLLGFQIVVYYAGSVCFMCATLYGIVYPNASTADRLIRGLFSVFAVASLFVSTKSVHSMTAEVRTFSSKLPSM